MKTFLIATRNAHKVEEIRAILGGEFQFLTLNDFPGAPAVVEDADTFAGNATKKAVELAAWLASRSAVPHFAGPLQRPEVPLPRESPLPARGMKPTEARPPSNLPTDLWVLADDSGLEVDALNGAPGVYSARFAAVDQHQDGNTPDADNNAKLLRLLREVPVEKRAARFRCVIALNLVTPEPITNASPVCYAATEPLTALFDGTCEGRIDIAPRGQGGFGYDPFFIPNGFDQSFAELGKATKNQLSHRAQALGKLKQWLAAGSQLFA